MSAKANGSRPEVTTPDGTLLVTVAGRDRPGVTSVLFEALMPYDVTVLDVEQVVIRGQLILGVLVAGTRSAAGTLAEDLRLALEPLGMTVALEASAENDDDRRHGRSFVTVLGHPLLPAAMAGIAGCISSCDANIDRIVRIAHYPVTAVELEVSGADPAALRASLALAAAQLGVDIAVQRSGLQRRAKRLVVLDVDSTLIQDEVIELLAVQAGCADEVARITEEAMRGEVDFADALRRRVALLAGVSASAVDVVRTQLRLTPGARTFVRTLKRLDYRIAIVSGGFTQVTDALVSDLGIDYSAANTLEIVDGRLTGRLVGPIVDRAGKAAALETFAAEAGVPLAQTVAIGDGANDLDMLARAGLGIAFNAKPLVREAADTTINVPYLDAILFLLGISRREIEAADAEEGIPVTTPPT